MSIFYRLAILTLFAALLFSCKPADKYQDRFWVTTSSANIYERPTITSKVLKELKFGSDVYCRDKNPSYTIAKGWVEAKVGDVRGFIERRVISGEDLYKEIRGLMDEAKGVPAQAAGLTAKKAYLRLKPDNAAFIIQQLKEQNNAEVLERIVLTIGDKEKPKKQVWYKVRLADGRVGFVTRFSFQMTPPAEINNYTSIRVPVSWYKLSEKQDLETGERGGDYLVTYASVDSDVDTDFTRIELYTYNLNAHQYATSLAKSGLYGILPIKIIDEGDGRKIIEIREHPRGDPKRVHVMQYSFPSPIKIVKEYVEE